MLKKLKLEKELRMQRTMLEEIEKREAEFKTREEELAAALNEAVSEEDMNTVNESIDNLEKEVEEAGLEEKKSTVNAEIERIESELADLEERAAKTKENKKPVGGETKMRNAHIRELLKTGEYYERADVKEFYGKVKELRGVTGAELTIPEIVINRIMDIVGDYSTMYNLVDKTKVKGKGRILLDSDTEPATWIEQTGAITSGDVGTILNVEFDGYKVGKIVFVDNSLLEDSIINLDDYVTKKIARAIAKAIDKSVLHGTGAAGKELTGIIPSLSEGHKVTVTADENMLKNTVKVLALVDDGADSVGEIVAVMKRSTYYNNIAPFSINVDADGNVVGKLPNLKKPDFLGLRIEFDNFMEEDQILFGDYEKYTLVEREDITIDNSIHVKFQEDQTAFRGKGRFDGKPTDKDAFVLVTLSEAAAANVMDEGAPAYDGEDEEV